MGPKKVGKSGKERQKLYMERIHDNAEKLAAYKEKEKARYAKRRDQQKLLPKSEREERRKCKKWREAQQRCRLKKKEASQSRLVAAQATPPSSAHTQLQQCAPATSNLDSTPRSSFLNKKLKRSAIQRIKDRQEIRQLRVALTKQKNISEKFRKRAERARQRSRGNNVSSTPRGKTESMTRGANISANVRKTLLFCNVLCESIKAKVSQSSSDKEKHVLAKLVSSQLLQKYKLAKFCQQQTGLSTKRLKKTVGSFLQYNRKPYISTSSRNRKFVQLFLERDDNSRITTGRNDIISRQGDRKQR